MNLDRHFRGLNEGVQIPVPLDEDGYGDRECPHEECVSEFKILADDWRDKVRDEEVFCPICGHTADWNQWHSQEQIEHVQQFAMREVQKALGGAMRDWSWDFNRRQPRGGFISMSMKYKPSVLPMQVTEFALDALPYTSEFERVYAEFAERSPSIGAGCRATQARHVWEQPDPALSDCTASS